MPSRLISPPSYRIFFIRLSANYKLGLFHRALLCPTASIASSKGCERVAGTVTVGDCDPKIMPGKSFRTCSSITKPAVLMRHPARTGPQHGPGQSNACRNERGISPIIIATTRESTNRGTSRRNLSESRAVRSRNARENGPRDRHHINVLLERHRRVASRPTVHQGERR